MLFSRTWQYAMRLLLYLARREPGTQVGARTIAAATGVPVHYAAKILGTLAGAGLVRGRRGPRGGVQLARPPARISLADVARGLGEEPTLDGCVLAHPDCSEENPCVLRPTWRRLVESILARTLDELSGPSAAAPPRAVEAVANPACEMSSTELRDELL